MQVILTLVAGGTGVALVPASMQVMKMDDVKFIALADAKPPTYRLEFAQAQEADNPVIEAFLALARACRCAVAAQKPRRPARSLIGAGM